MKTFLRGIICCIYKFCSYLFHTAFFFLSIAFQSKLSTVHINRLLYPYKSVLNASRSCIETFAKAIRSVDSNCTLEIVRNLGMLSYGRFPYFGTPILLILPARNASSASCHRPAHKHHLQPSVNPTVLKSLP
jgi:hypothetical protein